MVQPARARSNVRILIVEDHTLFAESLDLALTMERYDVRRVPVPEMGTSQRALLSAVMRLHPQIVLLDLDLGHMGDGVRLIAPLARSGAHVVVVTASADMGRWGECIWYGARKVLTKGRPLNEILATVRRISQGLPVMDAGEREELLAAWHEERKEHEVLRDRLERLTHREREVLGQLMEGHTVRDIAQASVVSVATVRTQVKSILAKLEVSSQLAAVGLAHAVDWHPPPQ
jgi:two-component system, NarL family, nitrate/nitrite response regulator NarL